MSDFATTEHDTREVLGKEVFTNEDPITEDDFDYNAYEHSW